MLAVYDLEVKESPADLPLGWKDYKGMGISWGCCLLINGDRSVMRHFDEHLIGRLPKLLNSSTRVVTFNGKTFDDPLLQANADIKLTFDNHIDLCELVYQSCGKRQSLDSLAAYTLGIGKIGQGAFAPRLYQEQRFAELAQYCAHDVRITYDLYRFAFLYGYVIGKVGMIPIHIPGGASVWRKPEPQEKKRFERATQKQIDKIADLQGGEWLPTPGLTKKQASEMIEMLLEQDHG